MRLPFINGSLTARMAASLSEFIMIGDDNGRPINSKILVIQIASLDPNSIAVYSDSCVLIAEIDCFFEDQETAPPAMRNMYPEVDLLLSGSPPKSASV